MPEIWQLIMFSILNTYIIKNNPLPNLLHETGKDMGSKTVTINAPVNKASRLLILVA
jgi:hypothetical protein